MKRTIFTAFLTFLLASLGCFAQFPPVFGPENNGIE